MTLVLISDTTDSDEARRFEESIRQIAKNSEDVYSNVEVDQALLAAGLYLADAAKMLKSTKGEFTRLECASDSVIIFTKAFKFAGYSEACHIRGSADLSVCEIELERVFHSKCLCR